MRSRSVIVLLTMRDGLTKRVRLNEQDSRAMFSPYNKYSETLRRVANEHGAVFAQARYRGNYLGEWRSETSSAY